MEPQQKSQVTESSDKFENLKKVTPLSKYLAMVLFIIVPFIGGWIGYTYAPERVVEVVKFVDLERPMEVDGAIMDEGENLIENNFAENVYQRDGEPENVGDSLWRTARFNSVPFAIQYPNSWEFSCCGDTDTRSNHFFYRTRTVENQYKGDILFTIYSMFDPEASLGSPTTLTVSEQFELLKDSFLSEGTFIGNGTILGIISYIYLMDSGEEYQVFMYKDRIYSFRFLDPNESIKNEFLQKIIPNNYI